MTLFKLQIIITTLSILLIFLLIFINLIKVENSFQKSIYQKNIFIDKNREEKNFYRNFLLFKDKFDRTLRNYMILLKLKNFEKDKYYIKAIIFSLFFSFFSSLLTTYIFGLLPTFFILILTYFLGNYLYVYNIQEKIKNYKLGLANEVIELFLTFHLLYPNYRNPDSTLRKIIVSNRKSEINRQMEHMLILVSEKGLESAKEYMIESLQGVPGLDIFIELYYNLKKEGIKALQNINSYIGNIITSNELIADKKINETKSKVELIIILIIFLGMVILIISPMFLGKFDGEHSLIDYLGFISGN